MTTDRLTRHPAVELAARNPIMQDLIREVIPEYFGSKQTAEAARRLAESLRASAAELQATWPASAEEVTSEWLNHEIKRRNSSSELEAQLLVLREVEFDSHQRTVDLVTEHGEDLLEQLSERFDDLVSRLTSTVGVLNGARTAAEAIDRGTAAAWKDVADIRVEYDALRHVQRTLYRGHGDGGLIHDGVQFGDGIPGLDVDARVYFHKNLSEVAPAWRGAGIRNGVQLVPEVPWPSDKTEQLVWFIVHDSGMWCPTPNQLRAFAAPVVPRNDPRSGRKAIKRGPTEDQSGHALQDPPSIKGKNAWQTPLNAR